jgi:glycosyltransferase involved in cell wall biosynthesis
VLFQGAHAVLANSAHEPFGLVGLEAMANGGVACTGGSGEDYTVPGYNALVLETEDPQEFLGLFAALRAHPAKERALRFRPRRHPLSATDCHQAMRNRFESWAEMTSMERAAS